MKKERVIKALNVLAENADHKKPMCVFNFTQKMGKKVTPELISFYSRLLKRLEKMHLVHSILGYGYYIMRNGREEITKHENQKAYCIRCGKRI